MKSFFYQFKVEDLIKTYKKNLFEQQGNVGNPKDKTQYKTVLYEIETKDKYVDEKGKQHNKEFFLNLEILIDNLIKENHIESGFAVCASGTATASIYVNHFEEGAMNDLSKALRKKFSKLSPKKIFNFLKPKKKTANTANAEKPIPLEKIVPIAKASAIGRTAMVLIIGGKLSLGKFDNVVYAEFDYNPEATFTVAIYSDVD
jgi:thiamine phosphate synthase YjbQ (UPF0047 family)